MSGYEPRDQNGMSAEDHRAAQAASAAAQGRSNTTELQALRLEVQELRQFCIQLVLCLRTGLIQPYPSGLTGDQADYWWEKLGSYQKVEGNDTSRYR